MPPRKRAAAKPPPETPRIHPHLAELVVPIADLAQFHKNPNLGDVTVIGGSLQRNGQYKPITVNVGTYTGRANEILAGNHTWQAAKDLGWPDIARTLVDVDEQAAARIVAADNKTAELAKRDPDLLAELLGGLDDLEGTGYSDADLAKLLGEEGNADDESALLGDQTYQVIIDCRDEAHQLELLETFEAEGLDARAMVT